jgi:hypothetical protein
MLVLSPLVLVMSVAFGTGLMLLVSLPFMETRLVNSQNESDWRRLFVYGGLIVGGLVGLLLVGAMWANRLFGWEPSWDRSTRRRR